MNKKERKKYDRIFIKRPSLQNEKIPGLDKLPENNNKLLRYRERYCYATLSEDQTLTTATDTIVDFDTFATNVDYMSATDGRIQIKYTWNYWITWNISFDANATWRRQTKLLYNWTLNMPLLVWSRVVQVIDWSSNWGSFWINSITWGTQLYLQNWDYIQIEAQQTSWWDLDLDFWYTSIKLYGIA